MKNWKLVTVAATLLSGLVFTAACTVEEGDPSGDAGAAGTGGSDAAGTGGTDAAGSAGAAGDAGAAGAAATPVSYAEFFTPADEADSACTTCLKTNCAAETTACGDVFGTGACAAAVACLADTIKPEDTSYDCAFVSCAAANPTEAVNDAWTCTADKCATECAVTQGFNSCVN
jgi:hypothetical protein